MSETKSQQCLLMMPPGSKDISLEKPCRVFTDVKGPIHCHVREVRSFRCSFHVHSYFRRRRQSFLELFLLLKTEGRECCWCLLCRRQDASRILQFSVLHVVSTALRWGPVLSALSLHLLSHVCQVYTTLCLCQILPQNSSVRRCVSQ